MRKCLDCGFEFDDDKSFCPSCGKYMPKIENPYENKFGRNTSDNCPPNSESDEELFEKSPDMEFEDEQSSDSELPPLSAAIPPAKPDVAKPIEHTPSVWSFVLSLFLLSVPMVGFIYAIVLAFGGTKYPAKRNFARGLFLYYFLALVVISALVLVLMFALGQSGFTELIYEIMGINLLG